MLNGHAFESVGYVPEPDPEGYKVVDCRSNKDPIIDVMLLAKIVNTGGRPVEIVSYEVKFFRPSQVGWGNNGKWVSATPLRLNPPIIVYFGPMMGEGYMVWDYTDSYFNKLAASSIAPGESLTGWIFLQFDSIEQYFDPSKKFPKSKSFPLVKSKTYPFQTDEIYITLYDSFGEESTIRLNYPPHPTLLADSYGKKGSYLDQKPVRECTPF